MHEILYNLGIVSLTIVIFYIVFWFDRRTKPSDFHLVRNHLQKVTHPHLIIKGHGDYYLEYILNNKQILEYFRTSSTYENHLKELKQNTSIKILNHGRIAHNAWKTWGET